MIWALSEVARTAHALRMMALTSGTVAALPSGTVAALLSGIVPALQRSPEQQSTLQVPPLHSLLSVAVLHFSVEEHCLL